MVISDELGIEHPKDPVTGENIIMTTDFLITIEKNDQLLQLARTLKNPKELDNYRQIEKFEIERRYCIYFIDTL
nr:TnsA endonuclease N-terminal domain-containing protein [Ruminiclostridium herbifermentans]